MSNLKKYMLIILKMTAVNNAIQLGWKVDVEDDKIILRKKIKDMTELDRNTFKLLKAVMNLDRA